MRTHDLHRRLDKLQSHLEPADPVLIVYTKNFFGNADAIEAGLERQRQEAAAIGIPDFDPSNHDHLDRLCKATHAKLMLPANGTEAPRDGR